MDIELISAIDILRTVISKFGFDSEALGIDSVEVLSALVRRTAGLLCPSTKKTIQKNILLALDGLVSNSDKLRDTLDQIIDMIISHGDLLEHNDIAVDSMRTEVIIDRAPLSFIKRQSGACIMLGVAPDDMPFLPDVLREKIQYNNFTRLIPADVSLNLAEQLKDIGLIELPDKAWVCCPPVMTPDRHIVAMDHNLCSSLAHVTNNIEGLRILDTSTRVDFYPARWRAPNEHTGKFIGRRPQAYGADLWCYVDLCRGIPKRFLDFPLPGSRWRGCDEAWHLQLAIDALSGNPQIYGVRDGVHNYKILDLYSPIPSWAQRRWVMAGVAIPSEHCLLSFRIHSSEIEEEIKYANEHLWLIEKNDESMRRR